MARDFLRVVVVSDNSFSSIKKCLDSVLEQTHQNFRCVVADNASTDFSPRIAEIYARKHPEKFSFVSEKTKRDRESLLEDAFSKFQEEGIDYVLDASGFLSDKEEFKKAIFRYENPEIDWGIFDHIYCIHFKPYEKRFEEIKETLSGVGILGRDNFSFWYTEPNPEYDRLYREMLSEKKIFDWNETRECGDFGNSKIFNLAVNSQKMF